MTAFTILISVTCRSRCRCDSRTRADLDEALQYCLERGYIELWNGESPDRFGGRKKWLVKRLTASGHDKLRELRGQKPL